MAKIIAGLKAAAKGLVTPEPQVFRSAKKVVTCSHCGGLRFFTRQALLNTMGSELVGMAWNDKEACVLVCAKCTRLEWFYNQLEGSDE